MKIVTTAALALCLAGCMRTVGYWEKPDFTEPQFATDRFECMRQSQEQYSSAYVNQYGGGGTSGQQTNLPFFAACMTARGYSWATKQVES
jgi:hypothetical protein